MFAFLYSHLSPEDVTVHCQCLLKFGRLGAVTLQMPPKGMKEGNWRGRKEESRRRRKEEGRKGVTNSKPVLLTLHCEYESPGDFLFKADSDSGNLETLMD